MTDVVFQVQLEQAIAAWKNVLGDTHVTADEGARREAEQCTFPTDQRTPAIIYPGSTEEIQRCVQIANDFLTPIYPISRGRNWGLGSKVPAESGCVLMDLHRMNKIIEFNDEVGYVTVEPGVTFQQVANLLNERRSKHFVPMIGGPPDSSVLGNFLERGDGAGPMGERVLQGCGLELVLGRGDVIHTGYEQIPGSKVSPLDRWGVGPSLDGLFSQSSFAVASRLTLWLCPRPNHFQAFLFTVDSEKGMCELIPSLRELQKQRVIEPSSVSLWNRYKTATSFSQHPEPSMPSVEIESVLSGINPRFKSVKWFGIGALYSGSPSIGKAQSQQLHKMLKPHCGRVLILDKQKCKWLRRANSLMRILHLPNLVDERMLQGLIANSVYLGNPTRQSINSLYWRKTFLPKPPDLDPHADRCGVHWICHSVPYTIADFEAAATIASETTLAHGLEPSLIFVGTSPRFLRLCLALHYDRDQKGADANAQKCHDQVVRSLNSAGYSSCRLGIQSMAEIPRRFAADEKVLADLKSLCDPKGILAPGRYPLIFEDLNGNS